MFSKKKGASWTYDTPSLFYFLSVGYMLLQHGIEHFKGTQISYKDTLRKSSAGWYTCHRHGMPSRLPW